jgi:molybdopterin-guanine dinucleotide biosynthesis protein A
MKTESLYRDVTGVILAGGRSRRMGRDKATLEVGGVTLFDRTLRMMRELFVEVLIAGDRKDLATADVPCYPDLFPGSALGGLYTGLAKSSHPRIFVCPCDMPYPNTNIARLVVSQDHAFDVVVPRTANGLEPLFACYHKRCLPAIKDMLDGADFCAYGFYPRVRTRYLGVEELPPGWQSSFLNVNTPEEYDRIKKRQWVSQQSQSWSEVRTSKATPMDELKLS